MVFNNTEARLSLHYLTCAFDEEKNKYKAVLIEDKQGMVFLYLYVHQKGDLLIQISYNHHRTTK